LLHFPSLAGRCRIGADQLVVEALDFSLFQKLPRRFSYLPRANGGASRAGT
jgi:hypothetical protein